MKEKKDYKLGLAINAFEGTEHIYNILSEIRDLVDYVVVGIQSKSYLGNPIDKCDLEELRCLKEEDHLVDTILTISPDSTKFSREQETEKRNTLIDDLEKNGCTHQLVIDSDEFYTHGAFERAKEYVYDNNVEISYCRYLNYFGSGNKDDYKTYLVYPFHKGNYVPFITKIKYRFKWQSKDFDKPSDPTRRYERPKKENKGQKYYLVGYYEFPWEDLKMHHFSWIRNDIRKKMKDWSSRVYFNDWYELVDRATERFEKFKEGDKTSEAILLFNTPDNKVDLFTMKNQYVFPKVDISERDHVVDNGKTIYAIQAKDRDWIETIKEFIEFQNNDWFVFYENQESLERYSEKTKEIAKETRDDSLSFSSEFKMKNIGGVDVLVPQDIVMLSKTTMTRILSPDACLLELTPVCTSLEIIGLSLKRYYDNIDIDYQKKDKTF